MTFHQINGVRIRTTHEFPPIPVRSFDWSAVDDDTYDCDCDQDGFFSTCPIGHGATEQEAIADLLEQIEEQHQPATDLMQQFDEAIAEIKAWVGPTTMQVDRGFLRSTVVMCAVDISSGVAGQINCIECGGDGDWSKFMPEEPAEPCPCVECKGTGRVWVSV